MIKVLKINNLQAGKKALSQIPNGTEVVAIETEFGDEYFGVKDGASVELLHHGHNENNYPAAVSFWKQFPKLDKKYDVFFISHFDLDTIFGIMWGAGFLKKTRMTIEISELIAEVDEKGFYWFLENRFDDLDPEVKYKYLYIGKLLSSWKFRYSDKDITDYSRDIHKLILKIKDVFLFDLNSKIKQDGDNFIQNYLENKRKLQDLSFQDTLSIPNILAVYVSDKFLLDAYSYKGMKFHFVLQYHKSKNSISLAGKNNEVIKDIFGEEGIQKALIEFFGDEAGGRFSVGGSPRNRKLPLEYLEAFIKFLRRSYFNI